MRSTELFPYDARSPRLERSGSSARDWGERGGEGWARLRNALGHFSTWCLTVVSLAPWTAAAAGLVGFGLTGFGLTGCSAAWYQKSADAEATAIINHRQKALFGVETEFSLAQVPILADDVGVEGTTADFRRTPAPQPVVRAVPSGVVPLDPSLDSPETPDPVTPEGKPLDPGEADPTPEPQEGPRPVPTPVLSEAAGAPPVDGDSANPAVGSDGGAMPDASSPAPGTSDELEVSAARVAPRIPARILSLDDSLRLAFANNRQYQTQRESAYLTALSLTLAQHRFAPRFFGVITGDYSNGPGGESVGAGGNFGMGVLLANGARLSLNVAENFLKFLTGDRAEVARSIISGTLTQPLLRGFGTEIVREPLTQAERNIVYQIRSLERFRRDFAVQVFSEYFRVLQTRDRVVNAYADWQGLVTNRDRTEAMADAERLPRYQVDQARQAEFSAENSWVDAVETYENAVDRFKITLGIPTDSKVDLDDVELERLAKEPVSVPPMNVDAAVEIALAERLDLQNTRDRVEDAERQVRVARDGLRMQLDVTASASLPSNTKSGGAQLPGKFNTGDLDYGVGLDIDLPLDRKAERNAYVAAFIELDRSRRDQSLEEDGVRLNVRESYRSLEREVASYKIQKASVQLAETRVDSTSELLQAGRADTREFLESQQDLTQARNALTGSLINYAIARQGFLLDIEALRVEEDGTIESTLSTGEN